MLGASALDLIEKLLVFPPYARLQAADALQHAWFTAEPLPAATAVIVEYLACSRNAIAATVNVAPLLANAIESPL